MDNAYFKLPFQFDMKRLKEDLQKCLKIEFVEHFNKRDYNGNWKVLGLRTLSGDPQNIYAHKTANNKFQDSKLLDSCSYFKEVISQFNCEKESIRLLNLEPGSQIKEHNDDDLGYQYGNFRIHIPIATNDDVSFIVNNHKIKMAEGSCWYADFSKNHSVKNDGNTDRIHLIIDCLRNEWSDEVFKKLGFDFELEKKKTNKLSRETTMHVIEELKRMDNDAAKELIKQYTAQLEEEE